MHVSGFYNMWWSESVDVIIHSRHMPYTHCHLPFSNSLRMVTKEDFDTVLGSVDYVSLMTYDYSSPMK